MRPVRSTWVRTAVIALAASILSVLATSVVVSAQGGAQQQIHACADARGTLRKVAASESCAAGESRVVWNAQGPAGATGPAGPPGAKGAQGPKGLRGRRGSKGKIDLSGYDVKTAVILARLKKLDKKLSDVKKTVLFNKGYLKGHHGYLVHQHRKPRLAERIYVACVNANKAAISAGAPDTPDCNSPALLPPEDR